MSASLELSLDERDAPLDPFVLFAQWYGAAQAAHLPEPGAMTLATATPDGLPAARLVLLRGFDEHGFVFFTNYESRKAQELRDNPRAALVLFWQPLHRQVRIEGTVERTTAEESDAYFHSRPVGNRFGAVASPQSQVIATRAVLEARVAELRAAHPDGDVPRPPHWGGYRVVPSVLEFWQGRASRLHDRLRYSRQRDGTWLRERLAP